MSDSMTARIYTRLSKNCSACPNQSYFGTVIWFYALDLLIDRTDPELVECRHENGAVGVLLVFAFERDQLRQREMSFS